MRSLDELLRLPVAKLTERFFQDRQSLPTGFLEALEADPRKAARGLARRLRLRIQKVRAERSRLTKLLRFEQELWAKGFRHIAGVDEAGVGPLAGPVVAAAVVLPIDFRLEGLDDSKKILEASRREELAQQVKAAAICWAIGSASPKEIDSLNIYHASLLAMRRAVEGLTTAPDYCLVDARTIPECVIPQRGIIHGDALSMSIAAASIVAKTTRDATMKELDRAYPGYGLAEHKGYSTPEHLEALERLGACEIHRRSFSPVQRALGLAPEQKELFGNGSRR